jgi:hypothetical protein
MRRPLGVRITLMPAIAFAFALVGWTRCQQFTSRRSESQGELPDYFVKEGGHGTGVRRNGSPLALRQGASACSRFDGGTSWAVGGHGKRVRDISPYWFEARFCHPYTSRVSRFPVYRDLAVWETPPLWLTIVWTAYDGALQLGPAVRKACTADVEARWLRVRSTLKYAWRRPSHTANIPCTHNMAILPASSHLAGSFGLDAL